VRDAGEGARDFSMTFSLGSSAREIFYALHHALIFTALALLHISSGGWSNGVRFPPELSHCRDVFHGSLNFLPATPLGQTFLDVHTS